jgi:hypothetical protein
MTAYCPKTKPFDHQAELFARTRDLESFALFWEMGCGKTLPIIDTMASLFLDDKIDGCLVLAPKAVAPNWVNDELPDHLPDGVADRAEIFLWNTSKAGGKRYQADLRRFLETP